LRQFAAVNEQGRDLVGGVSIAARGRSVSGGMCHTSF
jgi:hypothetical protein